MGYAVQVRRGDGFLSTGHLRNPSRLWVAPCFSWTKADQALYMDEFGLPINKLKLAIGVSGECFCGCFAKDGERELIKKHAPDVDRKLCHFEAIAQESGQPCIWGQAPASEWDADQLELFSMDLCVGCESRT